MSRRRWSALGLLTLLATTVSGGDLKVHYWPAHFVPTDLAHINVVMDIGYWIDFVNPHDTIKLEQVNLRTYEGCLDIRVVCNFNLSMCCTITPTGAIPGRYSCSVEGGDIDPPGETARLCVRLEDANVAVQLGGRRDVHVATVTIRITPRM